MTGRQCGKTTFAMEQILYKEKEEFVFFSVNEENTNICLKKSTQKNNLFNNRFKTQTKNYLKGRPPKYIICDNYELFDKEFRKDLYRYYAIGLVKKIFLFASSNYAGQPMNFDRMTYDFVDIVKKIKDIDTNEYFANDRVNKIKELGKFGATFLNDVIGIKSSVVLNFKGKMIEKQDYDNLLKLKVVQQRLTQNIF